jgi:hypothetical protein
VLWNSASGLRFWQPWEWLRSTQTTSQGASGTLTCGRFWLNGIENDFVDKVQNHPAFPVQGSGGTLSIRPNSGMSMRDWFASMSLIGYRASERYCEEPPYLVAEMAYEDADALLKQKQKQKE